MQLDRLVIEPQGSPWVLLPSAEITGCTWPFMWVLAIQTEVFVIVQQTL